VTGIILAEDTDQSFLMPCGLINVGHFTQLFYPEVNEADDSQ